jgi:Ser/Thr protein kinase RdoA (MazF antagonist)
LHESRLLREDFDSVGNLVTQRFRNSVAELVRDRRRQSVTAAVYGLIHSDVSINNCLFDGETPWIFDFDNCEYGYFLQDIATVLYDSIYCRALNQFADPGLTPLFVALLAGYHKRGGLTEMGAKQLQQFFLLREAVIYAHYLRS